MFEGKAACTNCEQHLNRDVVLPAISRLRPVGRDASNPVRSDHEAPAEQVTAAGAT